MSIKTPPKNENLSPEILFQWASLYPPNSNIKNEAAVYKYHPGIFWSMRVANQVKIIAVKIKLISAIASLTGISLLLEIPINCSNIGNSAAMHKFKIKPVLGWF